MQKIDFTFGNAFLHFLKAPRAGSFLWKFALSYTAFAAISSVFFVWLQWPVYEVYARMFLEGGGDVLPYIEEIQALSIRSNAGAAVSMPITLAMWCMFEAASQRRYVRGAPFALKLGADEGRLALIALILVGVIIGLYVGFAFAIFVPLGIGMLIAPPVGAVLGVVGFIAGLVGALWVMARVSAASALTIRDRQVRFSESWTVTRGKAWTIAGTLLAYVLIMALLSVLLWAFVIGFGYLQSAELRASGDFDAEALMTFIAKPSIWVPMALIAALVYLPYSALLHAMAGPGALAVLSHQSTAEAQASQTFD